MRYIERVENTARLLRVNAQLVLDAPRGVAPTWDALITIVGAGDAFAQRYKVPSERNVVRFLIGDEDHNGSIISCLRMARENARTVREILPRTSWELINEMHLHVRQNMAQGISKKGRDEYLDRLIDGSQQLVGLFGSVMYRDAAYHFSRIGRNLERADMTTRIIDVRSTDLFDEEQNQLLTLDGLQWVSVLKSLSGFQTYRRVCQVRVRRASVLDFLFRDTAFPRSVVHCLDAVEEGVNGLGGNLSVIRKLRSVARLVHGVDSKKLSQADLHRVIDEIQAGLTEVHDAISRNYFLREYDTQYVSQEG